MFLGVGLGGSTWSLGSASWRHLTMMSMASLQPNRWGSLLLLAPLGAGTSSPVFLFATCRHTLVKSSTDANVTSPSASCGCHSLPNLTLGPPMAHRSSKTVHMMHAWAPAELCQPSTDATALHWLTHCLARTTAALLQGLLRADTSLRQGCPVKEAQYRTGSVESFSPQTAHSLCKPNDSSPAMPCWRALCRKPCCQFTAANVAYTAFMCSSI